MYKKRANTFLPHVALSIVQYTVQPRLQDSISYPLAKAPWKGGLVWVMEYCRRRICKCTARQASLQVTTLHGGYSTTGALLRSDSERSGGD